jgi:MFS family permease
MFRGAPFPEILPAEHRQGVRALLFQPFYLCALGAIFLGGATEVLANQWASAFMERALLFPKVVGDLLGMCGFALMMGLGRTLYGLYGAKWNINGILIGSAGFSLLCYLVIALSPTPALNLAAYALCGLAVSQLWPGTIVAASSQYPKAGAWMFAILAMAGDIGASFGPWLVGNVADSGAAVLAPLLAVSPESAAIRLGLLAAAPFPLAAIFCHAALKKMRGKAGG